MALLSLCTGSKTHAKMKRKCEKLEKDSMPPLTAAEAMRAEEVLAEIHTSASDVGGASSISMLCEPESCLLPSLDCPEWALALRD